MIFFLINANVFFVKIIFKIIFSKLPNFLKNFNKKQKHMLKRKNSIFILTFFIIWILIINPN